MKNHEKINNKRPQADIVLEPLVPRFTVCKVPDYSGIDMSQPFCFAGKTDEENFEKALKALKEAGYTIKAGA